jgi:hypothetical protein
MIPINVYIIHYDQLNDRKDNINLLKSYVNDQDNINIKIITDHEPESINMNNIKNLISMEPLDESENQFYNNFNTKLSIHTISNGLKHFKAIQMISKEKENTINIVFEDDVMCSNKLFTQLNSLYTNINEVPWDIVLLGQPSEEVQSANNLSLKKITPTNTIFPCVDSYLIKPSFAKSILINFFPLRYPLNIQLSYIIDKMNNQNCYKIFPNITGDGSKIGIYTSSIMPNNVLLFNNIYKKIYTTLEKYSSLNDDQINEIKSLLEQNEYKSSPDFIHIEALLYMKIGDLQKSKSLFEKAYDSYNLKKTPMNNTSVFLKNYINIFKLIQ